MSFSEVGLYATDLISSFLNGRAADTDSHTLVVAKGLCILVIFIASAICGFVPFVLDRWFDLKNSDPGSKTGVALRFALYFGGGCLLCVTFQHIIVEVGENIAELQATERLPATAFDLALFLMCVGFMIMFLVEELIHMYMHRHGHNMAKSMDGEGKVQNGEMSQDSLPEQQRKAIIDVHLPPTGDESESVLLSSLRGLLVVLALSIHALFEGFAIGLQGSPETVWYVTGAVSGHKLVLSFCVGIELIAAKIRLWLALTYVFIFTIVAPIGIAAGIGLTSTEGADIPSVIIQGLASGTLIYVTFFEILFKERSGLWTYAGFVCGFFTIYGIIVGAHSPKKPVYCEKTVAFVESTTAFYG